MSYSVAERDDSDANTEGSLVEDEEEGSDQWRSDNNTLSGRDEDSASESKSIFSDTPWDLEPELQEIKDASV